MIQQNLPDATDLAKLNKLSNMEYRHSYLQAQVRSWIAYQFQAIRRKFGLSQAQMAERTGKTQSVISRLENTEYGKVSVQTLLDVANSLDVALLVQFVSYPEFLDRTRDKSEASMQPETIQESIASKVAERLPDSRSSRVAERMRQNTIEPMSPIYQSMQSVQLNKLNWQLPNTNLLAEARKRTMN